MSEVTDWRLVSRGDQSAVTWHPWSVADMGVSPLKKAKQEPNLRSALNIRHVCLHWLQ